MTTTLDTAPAAVLDNLPSTERAAILRAVAAARHPRTDLPTIAVNHHLTVDEVKYLVTRHGGLENPTRLLKAGR